MSKKQVIKIIYGIEKIINRQLVKVDKIRWNTIGYALEEGKIVALSLYNCNLTNIYEITRISSFSALKKLNLRNNSLTQINGLKSLINLQVLELRHNKIEEISGLDSLKKLEKLDLCNNKIKEIKNLESLNQLVILDLSQNAIKEIQGLDKLRSLKFLRIKDNYIKDIQGLNSLENLISLDLKTNKIHELKGLQKLKNLRELKIGENPICVIEKAIYLTKLNKGHSSLKRIPLIQNSPNPKMENKKDSNSGDQGAIINREEKINYTGSNKVNISKKKLQLPRNIKIWKKFTPDEVQELVHYCRKKENLQIIKNFKDNNKYENKIDSSEKYGYQKGNQIKIKTKIIEGKNECKKSGDNNNYYLNSPSEEQKDVLLALSKFNVVVDSVAGSGKTTCNLHIARSFPHKKILLLTYNARLKLETREKIKILGYSHLEAHSYHSFCVKYYDRECFRDTAIKKILITDKPNIKPFNYDIIILDEAQDITPIYFQLICKIFRDNTQFNMKNMRLCVLGDRNQSIYAFNRADERFIVFAHQCFNLTRRNWATKNLSQSFRVSQEISNFINECMFDKKRLYSSKITKFKPRYIICNCYGQEAFGSHEYNDQSYKNKIHTNDYLDDDYYQDILYGTSSNYDEFYRDDDFLTDPTQYLEKKYKKYNDNEGRNKEEDENVDDEQYRHPISRPYQEIVYYLEQGYLPQDIFILAPSVKSINTPVRKLENLIKENLADIPVYVPTSDEEKLDHDVLENKMIFSTFHQVKGLERKVVLVFGFDDSYFKYYKKDINPNTCPNELYVATTRAIERMSIFHHNKNDYLPFLNRKKIRKYSEFEIHDSLNIDSNSNSKNSDKNKKIMTPVTDLPRHVPEMVIDECLTYLKIRNIREAKEMISIPTKTKQKYGYESVSEITGTAIPAFFEYQIKGKINILDKMQEEIKTENHKLDDISLEDLRVEDLLYISTQWGAYSGGYVFKNYQIKDFSWLSIEKLKKTSKRLKSLGITEDAKFEVHYEREGEEELKNRKLEGFIDCIERNPEENQTMLYEFKCVEELEKEHYLQLAIYMYLYKLEHPSSTANEQKFYLYNVLTDELYEVECELGKLRRMMEYLIYQKYFHKNTKTDKRFLAEVAALRHRFIKF